MCEEFDEIEFQPTELDDDVPIGVEARSIFTEKKDREVSSLYDKIKRGKLVLQPDFQRKFVWDKGRASRLIESAILDIPLPVVYLSEEVDGREYVIDGQQRLTAFLSYIDNRFPDGTPFKLTGLRVLTNLNKLSFNELTEEYQDKIRDCPIITIAFKKESDPNLKFEIFNRLNTGSVTLNDQELRNCIFRGSYNELLKDLSRNDDFKFILDIQNPEKRMKDVELVLRFAAFYNQTYLKYKPPMNVFLNQEMMAHSGDLPQKDEDIRNAFKNATLLLRSIFGKNAFKRYYPGDEKNPNGRWETKQFNYSLYDILMWSFSDIDKNNAMKNADSIREAFINLMSTDREFIQSIELSTSSRDAVTTRFDKWRKELIDVVDVYHQEKRCFSRAFKQSLYDKNPTCAICDNHINDVDDAAVDHIEQYWRGGKTIPENARLTHRYCNWARSRKDVVAKK